jgi:hypothetical protein
MQCINSQVNQMGDRSVHALPQTRNTCTSFFNGLSTSYQMRGNGASRTIPWQSYFTELTPVQGPGVSLLAFIKTIILDVPMEEENGEF